MSVHDSPHKIGIGMPVYNGEKFLAASVESILSQTFRDFQLIISDNGSSDRTEQISRGFAQRDERVLYVRQLKNMGSVWNFNYLFTATKGTYFKWAAHDDLIEPTFLEKCIEILEQDQNCVLIHPRTVLVDEGGMHIGEYTDMMACDSDIPAQRFRRWLMARPMGLCNPLFGVIRRDTLQRTSLLGRYIASDRVLLGEIALAGRVRIVNEPLFLRRWATESLSTRANTDSLSLEHFHTGEVVTGYRFKTFRLIREFILAINRADISFSDKLSCYRVVGEWSIRLWKLLLKEMALPFYRNGRPTKLGRAIHLR